MSDRSAPWHLLQVSDVLDVELASALAELTPVIMWEPRRSFFPWVHRASAAEPVDGLLNLRRVRFPLLRGYARTGLRWLASSGSSIASMMRAKTDREEDSTLVCTVPYFASVAERWKGPVVYWLTDLMAAYADTHGVDIRALDRRMCRRATLVCPNSARLQSYLIEETGCDPGKVQVLPNATRAANVLAAIPEGPGALPASLRDVPRPIAGVIGNLAGNMDWLLIEEVLNVLPRLSWAFVGPTTMAIPDSKQDAARSRVMGHPRSHFVGKQSYGDLAAFARSFDVAVLPYLRCEPTYSGSSTRFYEHLCACRVMVATDGLEELVRKQPLLYLTPNAQKMIQVLRELDQQNFDDGLTEARWLASHQATWQTRAAVMMQALQQRRQGLNGPRDAQAASHGRLLTESRS